MKPLNIAKLGVLLVASAVLCLGQHGRGGAPSGHPSGPPSGAVSGMGDSGRGTSDRGAPASPSQSQKRSPQQLLDQNTKLSSNLQKLLPPGTTSQQACSGFSNLGQCVAAIHVSHNLGISLSDLKGKITGSNSEGLGKAIHELKPDVDANAEKKKAEKQAKDDINGSAS
jgi:hypothetical protein